MRPSSIRPVRVVLVLLFALIAVALAPSRPAEGGPIPGSKWSSIGPEPDCCFFHYGETGRATSVAVNPQNPDDVWIGTAGGGVWHLVSGNRWIAGLLDRGSLAAGERRFPQEGRS
jgi:hypothetical protein